MRSIRLIKLFIIFIFIFSVIIVATNMPLAQTPTEQLYTIQPGDTLNSIARKHNLPLEELIKANSLTKPDLLKAGSTLRMPVTLPTAPPPGAEALIVKQLISNKPEAPQTANPPQVDMAQKPQSSLVATKTERPADIPARLATGVYVNSVLGTLRINQTPSGVAVIRDKQIIPMRHLLYGFFDGSDSSGAIHGLILKFDATGQVTSLDYNSGTAKGVSFKRVQ